MSVRRGVVVAIVALVAAVVIVVAAPARYEIDGVSMAPGLIPGDVVATGWFPRERPDLPSDLHWPE